jgi:hypothetical protein
MPGEARFDQFSLEPFECCCRGPPMHAHIGMLKASNHGKPKPSRTCLRCRAGRRLGRCVRYLTDICRNNSRIRWTDVPALGVRAWGDITMTDSEGWKERRNQVARYRVMEHETTDPLAARLLHDIVLDLEAEFEGSPQSVGLMLVTPS